MFIACKVQQETSSSAGDVPVLDLQVPQKSPATHKRALQHAKEPCNTQKSPTARKRALQHTKEPYSTQKNPVTHTSRVKEPDSCGVGFVGAAKEVTDM